MNDVEYNPSDWGDLSYELIEIANPLTDYVITNTAPLNTTDALPT